MNARSARQDWTDRWVDAAEVARLLGYSKRHVLERLARREDFPRPLRLGMPRWKVSEVMAWADAMREGKQ